MCGAELTSLPESVQRVARVLQDKGHPHLPRMLDDAARTAQQAADALGIGVGQIAKSIIFRRKSDDAAVLVVTSGDRRVDEKKVEAHVGKVGRADADFVKSRTGFSIGGVSPVAHATPPVTLIDQDLRLRAERYASFDSGDGAAFEAGKLKIKDLYKIALRGGEPEQEQGSHDGDKPRPQRLAEAPHGTPHEGVAFRRWAGAAGMAPVPFLFQRLAAQAAHIDRDQRVKDQLDDKDQPDQAKECDHAAGPFRRGWHMLA